MGFTEQGNCLLIVIHVPVLIPGEALHGIWDKMAINTFMALDMQLIAVGRVLRQSRGLVSKRFWYLMKSIQSIKKLSVAVPTKGHVGLHRDMSDLIK